MASRVKRYFLELKDFSNTIDLNLPENYKIILDDKNNFQLNKFFYKQIGLDHYWRDRLLWSDKEIVELNKAVTHVANLMGSKEKGYRALTNIGNDGGQEVPHLHFHIFAGENIGKWLANGFKS